MASGRLLLFTAGGGGEIVAVAPAATASLTGSGQPTSGTIAATAPAATASLSGVGAPVTGTIAASAPAAKAAVVGTHGTTAETGWQVRAVDKTGTVINLIGGLTVQRVPREINGRESAEVSIPTLHPDADLLDLFTHEIQLWLDGTLYFWGRPARINADRSGQRDELAIIIDGLFSYFHDEVIGGEKENHLTSPHEDSAAVGDSPADWVATSNVEAVAIVDNNAEFWQTPKAIQVNNSESGENAYIYQRYTVDSDLVGVPFEAAAVVYVADNKGGAPAYGGPAVDEWGLRILRLDGSLKALTWKAARVSDDTPRNVPVRLQTDSIIPQSGETIEVRLYAPDAFTAWRWAGLFDGRAVSVDRIDKSLAAVTLVEHAQDVTLGKQNHQIGTKVDSLGETVSREWPWWRRDVIGEQIEDLADTFEFQMEWDDDGTERWVRVKRQVGVTLTNQLSKTDFTAWGLGVEVSSSYSRIYRQGEGSGIARDEWRADSSGALRGNVREGLTFGAPGETLAQLRDNAAEQLERVDQIVKLPRATVTGTLAKTIRPGDTVEVDLDHGWARFNGRARAKRVTFDGVALTAALDLEPVV